MKLMIILIILLIIVLSFLFSKKEVASKTTSSFLEKKGVKTLSVDSLDVISINFSINNEFKSVQQLFKELDNIFDNELMKKVRSNILSRGDIVNWKEYLVYEYEFKKLLILSQCIKDIPVLNEQVLIILEEVLLLLEPKHLNNKSFNFDNIIHLNKREKLVEFNENVSKIELFFIVYFYVFDYTGFEKEIYPILNDLHFSKKCLLYLFETDIEQVRDDLFEKSNKNWEDNLNKLIYSSIIVFKRKQEVFIVKPNKNKNLYYVNKTVVDTINREDNLYFISLFNSINLHFELIEQNEFEVRKKINQINIDSMNDFKKYNIISENQHDNYVSKLKETAKEIEQDEYRKNNPNSKKSYDSSSSYSRKTYHETSSYDNSSYGLSSSSCSSDSSSSSSSSSYDSGGSCD